MRVFMRWHASQDEEARMISISELEVRAVDGSQPSDGKNAL